MAKVKRTLESGDISVVIDRPDIPEIGPGGKAFTEVLVYKANNLLTPVQGIPGEGQYSISITNQIGGSAQIKEDNKTVFITDMTSDYTSIEITVNAEGVNTFKRYLTASKVIEGLEGRSVLDIIEQYYLSSSKVNLVDGEWLDELPLWEKGKYIWSRNKIEYTNPISTEYTRPVCDTSWEAMDNAQTELTEMYYEVVSRLEQTDSNIQATFSELGGYNLLRNTSFSKDITNLWTFVEGTASIDNGLTINGHNSLRIIGNASNPVGISQVFLNELTIYKNFCLTLYCYLENSGFNGNIRITIKDENNTVIHQKEFNTTDLPRNTWSELSTAFSILKADTPVTLYIDIIGAGPVWLGNIIMAEGSTKSPWAPHPSEIYDGVITLDKDGVEVLMEENGVPQGTTRLAYNGLTIHDSQGALKAYFGKDDTAYIKNIRCDSITSDALNKFALNLPKEMYVNKNVPSGSLLDGTKPENAVDNISDLLRIIKETYGTLLNTDLTINVSNGHYIEDITIDSFNGKGTITFNLSAGVSITGSWNITSTCPIVIQGGKSSVSDNNGAVLIYPENKNATHLNIRGGSVTLKNINLNNKAATDADTVTVTNLNAIFTNNVNINTNGAEEFMNGRSSTPFISVPAMTDIEIKFGTTIVTAIVSLHEYGASQNYIKTTQTWDSWAGAGKSAMFTLDPNTRYIRITKHNTSIAISQVNRHTASSDSHASFYTTAVNATDNSSIYITNADFSRYKYSLICSNSKGTIYNCAGTVSITGRAADGAQITLDSNIPCRSTGAYHNEEVTGGKVILGDNVKGLKSIFSSKTHVTAPETSTGSSNTKLVAFQNVYTCEYIGVNAGFQNANHITYNYLAQGGTSRGNWYSGYGYLPISVRDFCTYLNNITMYISITKHNQWYSQERTKPCFRYGVGQNTYIWKPDVSLAPNETVLIPVPTNLANYIANGTVIYLETYDSNSTTSYAYFKNLYLHIQGTLK